MRLVVQLTLAAVVFVVMSSSAYAACVNPAGIEGGLVYNSTHKVVQFCNGSNWISAGSSTDLTNLNASNLTSGNVAAARLGTGTANATTYLRGDGTWASISTGLPALTSANIWVGNASNAATAVGMSGDATLSNAGVLTIGTGAIGSAEITDGSVSNADLAGSIALSKLTITGTGSASNFLRGDGSWQSVPGGSDNLGNHIATQSIVSDTNNTDDLGSTAIRWKDGWFAGTVTGATFAGSGASLTNLPAASLTGTLPAISGANLTSLNATNLASGTVAAARMPALTGDVTTTAGSTTTNISASAVGSAEIADGSVANSDLAGSIAVTKLVLPGGTTNFLRSDGSWAAPSGGGSVPAGTWCGGAKWWDDEYGNTHCTNGAACSGANLCAGPSNMKYVVCPSGYTIYSPISQSLTVCVKS